MSDRRTLLLSLTTCHQLARAVKEAEARWAMDLSGLRGVIQKLCVAFNDALGELDAECRPGEDAAILRDATPRAWYWAAMFVVGGTPEPDAAAPPDVLLGYRLWALGYFVPPDWLIDERVAALAKRVVDGWWSNPEIARRAVIPALATHTLLGAVLGRPIEEERGSRRG